MDRKRKNLGSLFLLVGILYVSTRIHANPEDGLASHSYATRCGQSMLRMVHWMAGQPNRVVATHQHARLLFTFGQGTVPDKLEILGKGRKYLVYEGRITRIPVRLAGILSKQGKVPKAVAHRVSCYTDDHYSQWEAVTTVSTQEGALVLSYVGFNAQVELGIGMQTRRGVYSIFRIPTRLKYLAKASMSSIGKRIPTEDPEVDWDITMYGSDHTLVTLAESDSSKNYFYGGPELYAALTNLIVREDGTRVFDYPTDNKESWLVKASGLFKDRTPADFPYAIHEYGTRSMFLADHAFGSQARFRFVSGKLTVTANEAQTIDSDYVVLGDSVHPSMSFNLEELDRDPQEKAKQAPPIHD
jgi:hypothetical protein